MFRYLNIRYLNISYLNIRILVILSLFLINSNIIFGQRTDTLYQTLAKNVTGNNFVTSPVNTIGQANSSFTVLVKDDGSNLCQISGQVNISGSIDASYDNITYFPIQNIFGPPETSLTGTNRGYVTTNVYGAYPFVRAYVLWDSDPVHCLATINYTGSLQTVQFPYSSSGVFQGIQTVTGNLQTGSATLIADAYPNSFEFAKRIVVYGITLSNNSTSAASAFIGCASTNSPVSFVFPLSQLSLGANATVSIAPSQTALITCGPNNLPGSKLAGLAGTNSSAISYIIWYRYE